MKNKKIPMRRCAGCMKSNPKSNMLRIACHEGIISVDISGKGKGRGVYLCSNRDCIEKAYKRHVLQRSFEMEIAQEQLVKIFEELMTDILTKR